MPALKVMAGGVCAAGADDGDVLAGVAVMWHW